MKHVLFILLFWPALPNCPAQAQEVAGEWAWKPLFEHEGVTFRYIFYREANNVHNGVVIMLTNANDYDVAYRFKIVFRSTRSEKVEEVRGLLKAGESKTGDAEGLFWIPFTDGQEIAEVGLRGYRIIPRGNGTR